MDSSPAAIAEAAPRRRREPADAPLASARNCPLGVGAGRATSVGCIGPVDLAAAVSATSTDSVVGAANRASEPCISVAATLPAAGFWDFAASLSAGIPTRVPRVRMVPSTAATSSRPSPCGPKDKPGPDGGGPGGCDGMRRRRASSPLGGSRSGTAAMIARTRSSSRQATRQAWQVLRCADTTRRSARSSSRCTDMRRCTLSQIMTPRPEHGLTPRGRADAACVQPPGRYRGPRPPPAQ